MFHRIFGPGGGGGGEEDHVQNGAFSQCHPKECVVPTCRGTARTPRALLNYYYYYYYYYFYYYYYRLQYYYYDYY